MFLYIFVHIWQNSDNLDLNHSLSTQSPPCLLSISLLLLVQLEQRRQQPLVQGVLPPLDGDKKVLASPAILSYICLPSPILPTQARGSVELKICDSSTSVIAQGAT